MTANALPPWHRRARMMLGTLVEVGVPADAGAPDVAIEAAFAALAEVEACLSAFRADSDIGRFHALPAGGVVEVRADTAAVLGTARALHSDSGGLFDVTLHRAPQGWHCDGTHLHKHVDGVRLELGGIAKGHAVDRAVAALQAGGCASGWVNAGGDLRAFGTAEPEVWLRDENRGGVHLFARIVDGALATSHFAPGSRSQASGVDPDRAVRAYASVAAPTCLWADALTKVVAISGDAGHPLLARHGAQAWLH